MISIKYQLMALAQASQPHRVHWIWCLPRQKKNAQANPLDLASPLSRPLQFRCLCFWRGLALLLGDGLAIAERKGTQLADAGCQQLIKEADPHPKKHRNCHDDD